MRAVSRRLPSLSLLAAPSLAAALAAALAVATAIPVFAGYAYVVSPGAGIVTAIDTTTHAVAGVIATPSPARVEVTADGSLAVAMSTSAFRALVEGPPACCTRRQAGVSGRHHDADEQTGPASG